MSRITTIAVSSIFSLTILAMPICSHAEDAAIQSAPSPAAAASPAPGAAASPVAKKTIKQKLKAIKTMVEEIPARIQMDREFKVASAQFSSFCDHWQQNLRDRETMNRSKAEFVEKDGYQTATYTGYGKIQVCEAHQSKNGYSIGRITYEEFVYYLTGKSPEEAKSTDPKPVHDLHTTELFRWDKGKWFY